MGKEPDIRVLVGVEGDVGIDSDSGKLILNTLKSIAKNISGRDTPNVTFGVDFQKTAKKIYKQLSDITESVKLKPIDLNIQADKSPLGISIPTAKETNIENNVAGYAQANRAITDLNVKKARSIEITKQQEKATKDYENRIRDVTKALQFLGSAEEEKLYNQTDNLINKFGRSDLIPGVDKLKAQATEIQAQIGKVKSELNSDGKLSFDNFVEKLADPKASEHLKKIVDDVKKYSDSLVEFQKAAGTTAGSFNKELRNADNGKLLDDLILKVTKFEAVNDKFKSNSGLASEFERIKVALQELKSSGDFSKVDIDKLTRQFSEFKTNVVSLGKDGQTTFGKLRAEMEKLGVYFSASAIVMGAIQQLKQMTTNVIELDSAMTELKKVTNETDSTYSKFLGNAEIRAKKLGATLVDTVNATADFSRLGYSLKEAESISDAALVYKNVGD